jgi:hypothetical protein
MLYLLAVWLPPDPKPRKCPMSEIQQTVPADASSVNEPVKTTTDAGKPKDTPSAPIFLPNSGIDIGNC